jgi:hypothetical protein
MAAAGRCQGVPRLLIHCFRHVKVCQRNAAGRLGYRARARARTQWGSGGTGLGGGSEGIVPDSAAGMRASRRTSAEAVASLLGTLQLPAVPRAFQSSPMAAAALGLGERSLNLQVTPDLCGQSACAAATHEVCLPCCTCKIAVVHGVEVAHGPPEEARRITR